MASKEYLKELSVVWRADSGECRVVAFQSRGDRLFALKEGEMKIAKKFDGKGWFVFTVAAMAAEDEAAIAQVRAIFNNRTFYGSYETPEKMVERTCHTLENAKMARYSRRGWLTIEHPILGMLQWRSGVDFRTAQSYFILRLNGREVYRS